MFCRHIAFDTWRQNCLVSIHGADIQKEGGGWRCRFKDNKSCRSVLIKEGDQVEIEVAEISSLENAFDSWKGNGEKPVKE